MRIGELSSHTGVSRDALRFYEKKGLLKSKRSCNGYRDYPNESVALVQMIRVAQQLGFSLAEIAEHLPSAWNSAEPEKAIAELVRDKLQVIDELIVELTSLRERLLQQIDVECPFRSSAGKVEGDCL